MKHFLLDTNIFSETLKPNPNQKVLEKIAENKLHLVTASVVIHELWFGCLRLPASKRKTHITNYLTEIQNIILILLLAQPRKKPFNATGFYASFC